jgi:hypothetical protein
MNEIGNAKLAQTMSLLKLKAISFFTYVAVLLFPFQNFSLALASSQYDLASFVFLPLGFWATFKNGRVFPNTLLVFFVFVFIQILTYLTFGYAPFYRLVSGIVWFGGLVILVYSARRIPYDKKNVQSIIIGLLLATAIYIFIMFLLGQDRPKAWFGEPSYAGLCLYSCCAGIFAVLYNARQLQPKEKRNFQICFIIIFAAGVLTFSTHILTFLITISLLIFSRITWRSLPLILFFALVITAGVIYLASIPHYYSRLNLANPESNISLLSWMEGFDQMKTAINRSPIVGFGLGSTGYFPFESLYTNELASQNVFSVNLTDAYSAFFRLTVEMGLGFVIVLIIFLIKRFSKFKKAYFLVKHDVTKQANYSSYFLFVFAFSLIIGCLVKEPSYARSYVYLATFLIGSNRFSTEGVIGEKTF